MYVVYVRGYRAIASSMVAWGFLGDFVIIQVFDMEAVSHTLGFPPFFWGGGGGGGGGG